MLGKLIDKDKSTESGSGSGSSAKIDVVKDMMPDKQAKFMVAVKDAQKKSENAANDMQRGGVLAERASAICSALSPGVSAVNWTGYVDSVDSNSDGKGVLKIKLANSVYATTWNNAVSDVMDNTLLEPGSEIFRTASQLEKRDPVVFSGSFFRDNERCIKESSLSLRGKLEDPEFIFKFSSVKYLETPKVSSDNVKAPAPVASAPTQPTPVQAPPVVAAPVEPVPAAVTNYPPVEPKSNDPAVAAVSMDKSAPAVSPQSENKNAAVNGDIEFPSARWSMFDRWVYSDFIPATNVAALYRATGGSKADMQFILGEATGDVDKAMELMQNHPDWSKDDIFAQVKIDAPKHADRHKNLIFNMYENKITVSDGTERLKLVLATIKSCKTEAENLPPSKRPADADAYCKSKILGSNDVANDTKKPAAEANLQPAQSVPSQSINVPSAPATADPIAKEPASPIPQSTPAQTIKASFDCTKTASVQERLICSDSDLAAADLSLSEVYKKALSNASDPSALKAEQRIWVKDVRNTCFEKRCLFDAYSARSRELSQVRSSSVAPPAPVSNTGSVAPQQVTPSAPQQIIINVPNPADMQKALAPMMKGFPGLPGGGDPANSR